MKKLNITKERYEKSKYFKNKYGKLKYVSESGKFYKTDRGQILRFNETTAKSMATIEELYDPEGPSGAFVLTLANQEGDTEVVYFDMDVQEEWGDVNNNEGCFWECDPDEPDPEPFDGVGYGNDMYGYKKIVKVVAYTEEGEKEMTPEDFGDLCSMYVDWYSA